MRRDSERPVLRLIPVADDVDDPAGDLRPAPPTAAASPRRTIDPAHPLASLDEAARARRRELETEARRRAPQCSPATDRPRPTGSDRSAVRRRPAGRIEDPRVLLARATSARLEGEILRPAGRAALMDHGRRLGLSAFETNLVIATTQARARHRRAVSPVVVETGRSAAGGRRASESPSRPTADPTDLSLEIGSAILLAGLLAAIAISGLQAV